MSVTTRVRERLDSDRVRHSRQSLVEVCFGDGVGLTLFLAAIVFFVLIWRVGNFFNDIGLFAAMLPRVASGQLSFGPASQLDAGYPGMHYVGNIVYGRNYGQVVLSLPVYWLVDLVGTRAIRWVVVLGWSALIAVVGVRMGNHYDRRRVGVALGAGLAVATLAANLFFFKPLFESNTAIFALQLTSMVAAAVTGVLMYRLIARQTGRKLGVIAGAVTVFATPVGFWATVPKRHTFTAFFVVVALYALVRSRDDAPARLGQAGFRAIAYVSAGLLTWIHAPEGFTLFLALAVVDVPTAPSNDGRTLAVIGGAFALSLVPFLLTNYLISGNPVDPPRFLPTYNGLDSIPDSQLPGSEGGVTDGGGSSGGSGTDGGGGSTTGGGSETGGGSLFGLRPETLIPSTLFVLLQRGFGEYVRGAGLAVSNPDQLVTVFLRWGHQGYDPGNIFFGDGTNLSVLESMPIAAAVAIGPVRYGARAIRSRFDDVEWPFTVADGFALAFSVLIVALFLPRLPVRVMATVRYLHPLYPLLVYALFRQRWLTDALENHTDYALWGYEATVLLGTPLVVAALIAVTVTKGGVFQGFARAGLVAAGLLVATGLASASERIDGRPVALSFGLAAGITTVFLLVTSFIVMHYGPSALPAIEAITGDIRFQTIL